MTDVDEVFSLYTPETWGPQTPADWEETDQLSRELLRRQHGRTAASSASLFASWLRLPSLMRRRAWRQREIGAQLFEIEDAVSNVPGLHGIGVGVRLAEERPRLVVVVSSDANFSAPPRWPIGLPTFIKVGTLIPEMGDLDLIPIVIEYESRPVQLSSQDIIENGPCPPDHEPTLQTGLEVGGEDAAGLIETGSLSAIVRNASGERVGLGSAHVCGSRCVRWPERTETIIGTPDKADETLDASLITLATPNRIDLRLPDLDVLASPPVMTYVGMPVQMFGAVSGHQRGYLQQDPKYPITAHRMGFVSWISADIAAAPGDSGALLVSGHDLDSAVEAAQARYMSRGYYDSMICSMLGILRAGPSPRASSSTPPVSLFSPIIQIFDALGIQPETIERREVA